jgi:uncharacterized protein
MKNKTELRYIPAHELRISPPATDGTRTLSGYAIMFNTRSVDLGGFVEVVEARAVTDTLKGSPDILCLDSHDTSKVLGRTSAGTLKLTTDATGVRFACSLDTRSSHANDLAISIERGDISGCSFGFRTNKDAWTNENGTLLRTLQSIDLFEVSVTAAPAYKSTSLDLRSCPNELRSMLTRSLDDEDEDDCDCDCPECLAGDCADCSDPDCDDPNCEHGEDSARSLDLWNLEMRIALANRL